MPSPSLLIVTHSQSGRTAQLANAAINGARSEDGGATDIIVADPLSVAVETVQAASGYLFATPENFGYMSGALKYFFDRIYYPCENVLAGRAYGLIVSAGNDGTGAINSVQRIVTGLALVPVQPPLLSVGGVTDSALEEARLLGTTLAAGLDAGVF
ncbi:MAG: NAD(P)H-dependent oxidoreductase [Pseudomonadota bacterium]